MCIRFVQQKPIMLLHAARTMQDLDGSLLNKKYSPATTASVVLRRNTLQCRKDHFAHCRVVSEQSFQGALLLT